MGKYLRISSYIRKPFLIYDFATAPLLCNFPIYEENLIFFFISVGRDRRATVFHKAVFHKISTKDLKKGKNNGVNVSNLGGGGIA